MSRGLKARYRNEIWRHMNIPVFSVRSLGLVVWRACRQLFISDNGSLVVRGSDVCHGISSVSCLVMCVQSLLDRKRCSNCFYETSV